MRIKFWGVRGSTPVSGKEYLRHGGDTTCVEIRDNSKEVIIIDAGTGIRALGKKLARENLKSFTMLFTHSHWDHVIGFPFFKPVYNKNTRITVMGCSFSPDPVREIVAKTMQPPGFPVKFEEISAHFEFKSVLETGCDFEKIRMIPIETSHPNQGLGYKFEEGGRKFVFITDNELGFQHPGGKTFQDYVQFCRGADLLVHDATYTDAEYPRKKTWGHSTFQQAVELAVKARVRKLGLCHHDHDRTDSEIGRMVKKSGKILKARKSDVKCFAVYQGQEIEL